MTRRKVIYKIECKVCDKNYIDYKAPIYKQEYITIKNAGTNTSFSLQHFNLRQEINYDIAITHIKLRNY